MGIVEGEIQLVVSISAQHVCDEGIITGGAFLIDYGLSQKAVHSFELGNDALFLIGVKIFLQFRARGVLCLLLRIKIVLIL